MENLEKLRPLAEALAKLEKHLLPGRRRDRLISFFRSQWNPKHDYVWNEGTGKYECIDKVIQRDKEPPLHKSRKAPDYLKALDYVDKENPQEARNIRKAARRKLRKAGGICGV